jgi:hypothetical protein
MDLELRMIKGGNPTGAEAVMLGWTWWASLMVREVISAEHARLRPGMREPLTTLLPAGTRVSIHPGEVTNTAHGDWIKISYRTTDGTMTGWFRMGNLREIGGGDNNNQLVTARMMSDFGWSVDANELTLINNVLRDYEITDMRSIRLFFATCAHESKFGADVLETGSDAYFAANGYCRNTRGAGYMQLTHKGNHEKFLQYIKSTFNGENTAQHIAENYPWKSAVWYWATTGIVSTGVGSLNNYVITYGESLNVYLVTQFFVNGWPRYADDRRDSDGNRLRIPNATAAAIRAGDISWIIENGVLKVGNNANERNNANNQFVAPAGWDNDPITGRLATYNSAMSAFQR